MITLASISIFDGSKIDTFFEWPGSFEAACLQSSRDIGTKAIHRSKGVGDYFLSMPIGQFWKDARGKLK